MTPSSTAAERQRLMKAISDRLETGLNGEALQAIADLLEQGVHPDTLVAVVTSLSQIKL